MQFVRDFLGIFSSIAQDLHMYLLKDSSVHSKLQIFLTSPSFHGLMAYRFYSFFNRYRFYILSWPMYFWARIIFSMDIHPSAEIQPGVVIDHGIGVVIGETASVGTGSLIYHGVTLGAKNNCLGKRHPQVGNNVVIGAGAKILGYVFVGNDVKIGANSVVLRDIPSMVTAAGVPAEIKKNKAVYYAQKEVEK